jgi:hypothetical protein
MQFSVQNKSFSHSPIDSPHLLGSAADPTSIGTNLFGSEAVELFHSRGGQVAVTIGTKILNAIGAHVAEGRGWII